MSEAVRTGTRRWPLLAVAVAGAAGAALWLGVSGAEATTDSTIRVNDAGQTYGSDLRVESFEDTPDLVAVVATNGREGYVLREDLYEEPPASPEEALALNEAKRESAVDGVVRTIPVVESDGVTHVGEFEIALAEDPAH